MTLCSNCFMPGCDSVSCHFKPGDRVYYLTASGKHRISGIVASSDERREFLKDIERPQNFSVVIARWDGSDDLGWMPTNRVFKDTRAIDWTKPVQTKRGDPVRILCTDSPNLELKVIGWCGKGVQYWYPDGRVLHDRESSGDLENVPEPKQTLAYTMLLKTRVGGIADGKLKLVNSSFYRQPIDTPTWKTVAVKEITITEGEGL